MKTSLYRFYDRDGLLYVGISLNVFARISQHKREKHWFDEVTDISVTHFDSRDEALDEEARAIKQEFPKYNIAMNNGAYTSLDKTEEIARLEHETIQPTMSDEFNTKYKELKEKIMHLALEKITGTELPMKYSFLEDYDESFENVDDVLKLAGELANMDYAIEQARNIAFENLRKFVLESKLGEEDE